MGLGASVDSRPGNGTRSFCGLEAWEWDWELLWTQGLGMGLGVSVESRPGNGTRSFCGLKAWECD